MKTNLALIATLAAMLAGCATPGGRSNQKFACSAPIGVHCMSARDVYRATETSDAVGPDGLRVVPSDAGDSLMLEGGSLTLVDATSAPLFTPIATPPEAVPLRAQARVMRVWLAPWEDSAGDLHMAGHVFTEIEPRRWTVGERTPAEMVAIEPFQLRGEARTASRTPAPADGSRPVAVSTAR